MEKMSNSGVSLRKAIAMGMHQEMAKCEAKKPPKKKPMKRVTKPKGKPGKGGY